MHPVHPPLVRPCSGLQKNPQKKKTFVYSLVELKNEGRKPDKT
jgi:hypothetical protein